MPDKQTPNNILNVMFVDDEAGLCLIFVDEYAAEGVSVSTYTDPAKAIAAALREPPDLLFLDFRMPGTNGDLVAQAMPASIQKYLISGDIHVETKTNFILKFAKPMNFDAIAAVIDAARKAKLNAGTASVKI